MKNRILSLILMFAVVFLGNYVFAETVAEENVSEFFEITLKPENYATIHITKSGYKDDFIIYCINAKSC